jgi:hypothetical protein
VTPLLSLSNAFADTDPFPGVSNGQEIPGTRVDGQQPIDCPAGSGRGIEVNATTGATYTYCVKTWQSQEHIYADAAYRAQVAAAQADALQLSQSWNAEHPGQQKCFPWGPFTDPNGGTSSGGICANPVPAPQTDTSTVSQSNNSNSSNSETSTQSQSKSSDVPVVNTNGFGGYAVVAADGHVCGVIVANSNDPFNNGGVMPNEYMGCPAGSRIIFQSGPSQSGNVAGYHGENVIYQNNQFIVGGSDTITIQNGIATSASGASWVAGTGQVIVAANAVQEPSADTATSAEETATSILMGSSHQVISNRLPSVKLGVNSKTGKQILNISTNLPNSQVQVIAQKRGKSPIKLTFNTNSRGQIISATAIDLRGYTVSVTVGKKVITKTTLSKN